MLHSCKYCGRIHDKKIFCDKKKNANLKRKKSGPADKFRNTKAWQDKREQIKKRDKYLCQLCLRKIGNYNRQYNSEALEVHHIEPLNSAYDKRLENTNLLTLCREHHEAAEAGEVTAECLQQIAEEQEANSGFISP